LAQLQHLLFLRAIYIHLRTISAVSMLRFAIFSVLTKLISSDESSSKLLRRLGVRKTFIGPPSYTHRLRVCNAYTGKVPIEMMLKAGLDYEKQTNLTKSSALAYKACRDFPSEQINRGDSVEFKAKGEHLGSFAVNMLPRRQAILLLVVHRKKGTSNGLAFTSHVFAEVPHAQVAILDMYQGKSKSRIAIEDQNSQKGGRKEELAYDSVVAINSGNYKCVLEGGMKPKGVPLSAGGSRSYVAIRVGNEGDSAFPEDIMVFPGISDAASRAAFALPCLLGFVWGLF